MNGNNRGGFPTGGTGGDDKRGHGVRNYYLGGNKTDFGEESSGNISDKEKKDIEELQDFKMWINEEEGREQFEEIRNTNVSLTIIDSVRGSNQTLTDFSPNFQVFDGNRRDYVDNVGVATWDGEAMVARNTNYQQIRNYNLNQAQERAFEADTFNSSNFVTTNQVACYEQRHEHAAMINNSARQGQERAYEANNDIHIGNMDQVENNGQRREHVAGQDATQVALYRVPLGAGPPLQVALNNTHLSMYVSAILQAYVAKSGEDFADCLSMRDEHVFILINTFLRWPHIWQICNVPFLAEVILHHLEVLKALMYQNLQLAVYHQRLLVNLLDSYYDRGERWLAPALRTAHYELSVVMFKEVLNRFRRVEVRVQWTASHAVYCLGNGGCYCQYVAITGCPKSAADWLVSYVSYPL